MRVLNGKEKAYEVWLNGMLLGIEYAPVEWEESDILTNIRLDEMLADTDKLEIKFI